MKVMVIVKSTAGSEAGEMPSQELLAAMGDYNEMLVKAGIMQAGEGLHPSSKGARVRFSGKDRFVTDGPFAETKELIAGFWMWKVKSMEEAIEWVKRCPNPMNEDSDIEIRPVFEVDDFGDAFTPELREQEANIRAQTLGLGAVKFENGKALRIAGLNERYTMATRSNIPAQWDRFVPNLGKVAGQVGEDSYGLCWNTSSDGAYDYLTGVELKATASLPGGFTEVSVPAQRYAVFEYSKPISAFPQVLETIWSQWVPECGLKVANAPCFERYTKNFKPEGSVGGMEFWIPIAG